MSRPLTLAYRPLPSVRYVGIIQPNIRTFSSTWIKYNQLHSTTNALPNPAATPSVKEDLKVVTAQEVIAKAGPTSRIGKFIQHSKELIRFYKDGLKLLWSNNKEAKALQLKVKNEDYQLTRSEFQMIHQSKKDMLKLIPFGFVFLVLPESVKY